MLHPRPGVAAGVHPSAVVDRGAQVAPSAAIGRRMRSSAPARSSASARASAPAASSAPARRSATTSLLHANVTVYDRCVVGPRTILHTGAVIGADGFGMAEENGRWLKIPQLGRVVIGADVEIGANTTIDRGAIDDTVIEDDVKLDNQIQIGHNCRIGAHTAIAGCVGIAGSTRIGRNCKIGGAAMIAGTSRSATTSTIRGATASVHRSITMPGVYAARPFSALPHDAVAASCRSSCSGCPSLRSACAAGARAAGEARTTRPARRRGKP